ncbi:TPA: hypothetical protein ACGCZG_002587 [Acinetobacter baumannii]
MIASLGTGDGKSSFSKTGDDAPDVTPEQDYITIDEDLNSVWANYYNDPPSHWMHFHSVPNVSGAEQ